MGNSERDHGARDEPSERLAVDREEPTIASDPPEPSTSPSSGAAAPTVGPNAAPVRSAVPDLNVTPADLLAGLPPELAEHPRYCPLELLGQGGMGSVFKASHRVMDRVVALKVIRPELARPDIVERFRREIRAAARLSHPNIVTAHDAEQAGDVHFLVVEYIDGLSLDRLVARDGAMDVQRACTIVRQVAEGLQHAYEVGMVHRDIKPQNIMCTATGQVKILDFGLALIANDASNTSALTQGGGVMGTPDYIAPEQAHDAHAADTRSDIYSLGCTLYFLLRGKPPFSDGSIVQKLMSHLEKDPPSLCDFRGDLPPGLLRVIQKSMAKRPADRYQTPWELQQALRPYCEGWDADEDLVIPTLVAPVFAPGSIEKPPIRDLTGRESSEVGLEPRAESSSSRGVRISGLLEPNELRFVSSESEASAEGGDPRQASYKGVPANTDAPLTEHSPTSDSSSLAAQTSRDSGETIDSSSRSASSASAAQPLMGSLGVASSAGYPPSASEVEMRRSSLAGKVALFLGFFTLLFAWIPCVGLAMLPFSCSGLGLAIFSIVMSWGIPETRVRYQVAAAIICSVSIAVSAMSGFLLQSLSQ